MIKIYDTKTRSKREFVPVEPGKVGMYVCGPTVYNYIHIGNARTFISFDTIRRYLTWRGFEVTFVQNVTDVDDKIITKAAEEDRTAAEVAKEYTDAFIADMHAAGVQDPDIRPKATEEIDTMINLVQKLIDKGHAYAVDGDVYFAVRSYSDYGALSNRNVDEMESGHRELRADGQGLEDRKRDPLDFALWKAAKPGEPSWESPWGQGRPGWHIECSAMSEKYLKLPFDIHGGGADLCFPHHENERAQSEAAFDTTFANYWMHGGMLQINSEKMSKSLGNFLLLRDILETTDPAVLRMLMLQTHYRSPLDFSDARLKESAAALERLENFVTNTLWLAKKPTGDGSDLASKVETLVDQLKESFTESMDDDFNTAGALGAIFNFVGEVNTLTADAQVSAADAKALTDAAQAVVELMDVLGISIEVKDATDATATVLDDAESAAEMMVLAMEFAGFSPGDGADPSTVKAAMAALLDARANARAAKNYAVADAIRDGLNEIGFRIEDTPQGARIVKA
ncbi:cysteine--tRNA ligase [Anaerotardibacter muris]|uniref:cysteine--tRNA ligase n=1 Tax=Anaerotardibacter muris TaxID=2941505 RepID=UPI00203C5B0F|nr:cysteine--tRNA ligase [Anaerotardibacter muris]